MYVSKINLASMYVADWRQQAGWEVSAEWKSLNWAGNVEEVGRDWGRNRRQARVPQAVGVGLLGEPLEITELLTQSIQEEEW